MFFLFPNNLIVEVELSACATVHACIHVHIARALKNQEEC